MVNESNSTDETVESVMVYANRSLLTEARRRFPDLERTQGFDCVVFSKSGKPVQGDLFQRKPDVLQEFLRYLRSEGFDHVLNPEPVDKEYFLTVSTNIPRKITSEQSLRNMNSLINSLPQFNGVESDLEAVSQEKLNSPRTSYLVDFKIKQPNVLVMSEGDLENLTQNVLEIVVKQELKRHSAFDHGKTGNRKRVKILDFKITK